MNPDCPNPTRFNIFWENLKVLLNSVIKFTKKTFIISLWFNFITKNQKSNGYVTIKILSHKQCDPGENQCISRQLAQMPHLICVWF